MTQTTLTRSIDEPEWAKLHSSCTRFYINWIKFSKNGMDFQGITIPLFKSRPANEDNSIVAKGYAIADFLLIMNIKVSLLGYQLRIY
jgi:hypothetical protein